MRFFSNDAKETTETDAERHDDAAGVPQQRAGSPWSETTAVSNDSNGSANHDAHDLDGPESQTDTHDSEVDLSLDERNTDENAHVNEPTVTGPDALDEHSEADTTAEADLVDRDDESTTYASASAAETPVQDEDRTLAEDPPTPVDTAPVVAVVPVPTAETPVVETPAADAKPGAVDEKPVESIFGADHAAAFKDRWRDVQLRFVDSPKDATTEAAGLLDEAVDTLTTSLKSQKDSLLSDSDDTEKLRVELRGYREILNKVLAL